MSLLVGDGIVLPRERHPRFCFDDGNVIFLVESTLFKVHRYFFQRDSPVFKTMFSLPPPNNERPEGEAEDNPILLLGIEALEFERFLSILYPQNFLECDLSTTEEWTSVLTIASIWDFSSLRHLAISRLDYSLDAVKRIVLGKRFDVCRWLTPAYFELCARPEPLTYEEEEKLGMRDVIKIGQVRHQIRYGTNLNRHEDTMFALVRDMFL